MAYTMTVATRIANYGADKMDAQGYKVERMADSAKGFYADRPAIGDKPAASYLVGIIGDFTSCTCKFHAENKICKHVVSCQRLIADEAQYNAHEAAYEDYLDEVAAREEVEAGAPVCIWHGAHEVAENGFPLSFCQKCERLCL